MATVPIGQGVDACRFDPGTQLAFASNGGGTLTVIHEDAPDRYTVVGNDVCAARDGGSSSGSGGGIIDGIRNGRFGGGALGVFLALDFFPWFVFWELSLVPAFFLIKLWGGPGAARDRTSPRPCGRRQIRRAGDTATGDRTLQRPAHDDYDRINH